MKITFIIALLIISASGGAQDSAGKKRKLEVRGYIKNLESLSFDKKFDNLVSGNVLHNRLNAKWKPTEKLTAAAEFRTRLFWGDEVRVVPGFAQQLRNANEKINLQKIWIEKPSLVLHTNVERLYADYRGTDFDIRAGRQRINWGIATTWNPNDIFNVYNFLDFDYEERPGADGGKFQYRFNDFFNAEIAYAHTGKKDGSVAALKYALNRWNYDMQLIMAWYNEHVTVGTGWAGNIGEGGFKGEVQYFFRDKDSIDHLNLALEGDYMFKKGWYLNLGFLFNNQGIHRPVNNWNEVNLTLSPENLMPTKWNFIVTTAKEFTPLLSGNMSVLYAPGTQLVILLPSFKYNLATNFDADLIWQSFFAELNKRFEAVNHRGFLRLKWSF